MKEITIAGGGLAGLSLGIALRREGVPVTLHEAGSYPRHRVCGEFINGVSRETLARLGIADVLEGALRHHETNWFLGSEHVFHGALEVPALGISRCWLDEDLAARFVRLGGDLQTRSRQQAEAAEGFVWAAGRQPVKGSRWLGLKFHVQRLDDCRGLEMHLGRFGYVGLAPVEDGRVNVCGLFQNRGYQGKRLDLIWNCLATNNLTELAERLAAADPDEKSFVGVSAFAFGAREVPDGLLALGDSESIIPPFTGNGMSMAFEAAEVALAPLTRFARGETDWAGTTTTVREDLRSRFQQRLFTARVLHPLLLTDFGRMMLVAAARSGVLPFGTLSRMLR